MSGLGRDGRKTSENTMAGTRSIWIAPVFLAEKQKLRVGLGLPLTATRAAASQDFIEFEHERYLYFYCLPNGKWRSGKRPDKPLLIPLK